MGKVVLKFDPISDFLVGDVRSQAPKKRGKTLCHPKKRKLCPVLTTLNKPQSTEGVDTCRDRALNASGRGYYGQANAGRAAKATHGTQVPS